MLNTMNANRPTMRFTLKDVLLGTSPSSAPKKQRLRRREPFMDSDFCRFVHYGDGSCSCDGCMTDDDPGLNELDYDWYDDYESFELLAEQELIDTYDPKLPMKESGWRHIMREAYYDIRKGSGKHRMGTRKITLRADEIRAGRDSKNADGIRIRRYQSWKRHRTTQYHQPEPSFRSGIAHELETDLDDRYWNRRYNEEFTNNEHLPLSEDPSLGKECGFTFMELCEEDEIAEIGDWHLGSEMEHLTFGDSLKWHNECQWEWNMYGYDEYFNGLPDWACSLPGVYDMLYDAQPERYPKEEPLGAAAE